MTSYDEELSALHRGLTRKLQQKLDSGDISAAELGVIRQFLKDCDVDPAEADRREGGAIHSLVGKLPFQSDEEDLSGPLPTTGT